MTTLLVGSEGVLGLIRHPVTRAVTLTGSDRAGAAVAAEAGKQLKKAVPELGEFGTREFVNVKTACVR